MTWQRCAPPNRAASPWIFWTNRRRVKLYIKPRFDISLIQMGYIFKILVGAEISSRLHYPLTSYSNQIQLISNCSYFSLVNNAVNNILRATFWLPMFFCTQPGEVLLFWTFEVVEGQFFDFSIYSQNIKSSFSSAARATQLEHVWSTSGLTVT